MFPYPTLQSGSESEDDLAQAQKGKSLQVKSKRSYESDKSSSDDSDRQSNRESDEEINKLGNLLHQSFGKSSHDNPDENSRNPEREDGKKSDKQSSKKVKGFVGRLIGKPNKASDTDSDNESDIDSSDGSNKESSKKAKGLTGRLIRKPNKASDTDSDNESDIDSSDGSNKESSKKAKGLTGRLIRKPNKASDTDSDNESDIDSSDGSNKESSKKAKGLTGRLIRKPNKASDTDSDNESDIDSSDGSDKESSKKAKRLEELFVRKRNSKESDNDDTNGRYVSEEESGEENSAKHEKATHFTKEQRDAVTQIRNLWRKDYYAILGLSDKSSSRQIKRAFMEQSKLVHPDKNPFKDARKAFQMVTNAYDVLNDPSKKEKYDRKRKKYKRKGKLAPVNSWGEEFADNASGIDSQPDSNGDDSEVEKEMEPLPEHMKIYTRATPLIRELLMKPTYSKKRNLEIEEHIDQLNGDIQKLNIEYNEEELVEAERQSRHPELIPEDARSFFLKFGLFQSIGHMARTAFAFPNKAAAEEQMQEVEKQLERTIRLNSYPPEWIDFLPWSKKKGKQPEDSSRQRDLDGDTEMASSSIRKKKHKERKVPSSSGQKDLDGDTEMASSSIRKKKYKERKVPSSSGQKDLDRDTEMASSSIRKKKHKERKVPSSSSGQKDLDGDTEMASSSIRKKKGKQRKALPSPENLNTQKNVDRTDAAPTKLVKWQPGQTKKGERILGWRPFYKTDRKTKKIFFNGCQLVIYRKGEPNQLGLLSGEEAGRRVVDAYRNLPENMKNDVRYSAKNYTYEDAYLFDEIRGFACKPFKTKTRGSGAYYPPGYALYSFTDGSEKIVSRECMRKVFGKTDADNEIADFYEDIGETPPWLIEPEKVSKPKKKLLPSGHEVTRRSKSRRYADSDVTDDESSDDTVLGH